VCVHTYIYVLIPHQNSHLLSHTTLTFFGTLLILLSAYSLSLISQHSQLSPNCHFPFMKQLVCISHHIFSINVLHPCTTLKYKTMRMKYKTPFKSILAIKAQPHAHSTNYFGIYVQLVSSSSLLYSSSAISIRSF